MTQKQKYVVIKLCMSLDILGHVHIEVVIFFILYLPSNICLYGGLFLCMFEENGSHKTRINNKSVTEG